MGLTLIGPGSLGDVRTCRRRSKEVKMGLYAFGTELLEVMCHDECFESGRVQVGENGD